MNSTPIIENLTEYDTNAILHVLDLYPLARAADVLAGPPPLGLFRAFSRSTLCRIRQQARLEDQLATRAETRAEAARLQEDAGPDLLPALRATLAEKAFQLALADDPASLQLAARLLVHLDKTRSTAGRTAVPAPPAPAMIETGLGPNAP